MKQYILFFCSLIVILSSISADVGYYSGYDSTPVLMLRSDFEASVKTLPAKDLRMTSRISLKGNYIYIVELYRGVHVIDNSDSKNPVNNYFINIPGCVDMTIKETELYARSAEDLVAIDISDLSNVKEITRVRETFPELYSDVNSYGVSYKYTKEQRLENTVIVAWTNNQEE